MKIPTFRKKNVIVVMETPKTSHYKFAYDKKLKRMIFKHSLPEGHVFPYDFGFIPNTKGGDGDPLDAIIIAENATFSGCVIECRILGAMVAEQEEKGRKMRNDRIIVVPAAYEVYK